MERILLFALSLFLMAGSSSAQNAVGSLGGEVAVTHEGLATYNIPIEVVPGTKGVQPGLAVTYNSAGGRGLLGTCWTLSGLSSIARTPRDFYHDGDAGSVNYDGRDRYALDGARLVRLSTGGYSSSGAVYGKEVEDFTRVTLGGTPDTQTQYFTAVTADGTVVEYGYTSDSKQTLNNNVLSWWIDKATDPDGNFMTFQYTGSGGEILPDMIEYTMNTSASLSRYAKVRFSYTDDPRPNKTWAGGKPVTTTKLLSGITVWYYSTLVREYAFEYTHDRCSRLTAVVLKDGSGAELTRTSITWGSDGQATSFQTVSGLYGYNIKTGDFDGDNRTDLLMYSYDYHTGTISWAVRKGDGAGHFTQTALSGAIVGGNTAYNSISAADYDGDGIDDIGYAMPDGDSVRFLSTSFVGLVQHTDTLASVKDGSFLAGRFLGTDGLQVLTVSAPSGNTKTLTCLQNDATVTVHKDARLSVTDINGNGKSEIQAVGEHSVDVYEYDAQDGDFSRIVNSQYMEHVSYRDWFGDFNGDGYTDYVYYSLDGFFMKMSKGNDYTPSEALPFNSAHSGGNPSWSLVIGDVNGDGRDDIVQPVSDSHANEVGLIAYITRQYTSSGWMYDTVHMHHAGLTNYFEGAYTFAELNGDGKDELFYTGSIYDTPVIIGFREGRSHDLASAFTDGYGKTTGVLYGFYGTPDVGYLGCSGRRVRWPLAKAVLEPDGIGGTAMTYHSFGEAFYDDARRQLLGFRYHEAYRGGTNTKFLFMHDTVYHRAALEQASLYYEPKDPDDLGGYITDPTFWLPSRVRLYHTQTSNVPAVLPLDFGRIVPYDSVSSVTDRLGNTERIVRTRLTEEGRLDWTSSSVRREKGQNGTAAPWVERDSTVYAYVTVTLPNGRQVKKPSSVKTWHRRNGYGQSPWHRTAYAYSSGRLSSATVTDSDGTVASTAYTYNALGLTLTETLTPYGLNAMATSYAWDGRGRFVTGVTDPLGNTGTTAYDDMTGLPLSETDINGLTTSLVRDAFGRVVQETRPDGTVRSVAYLWNNLPVFGDAVWYVRETEAGRPETKEWHDILGRTVHTYRAGCGYHDVVYDTLGRVVRTTAVPYSSLHDLEINKTWCETSYDHYGRVADERAPHTRLTYTYHDPTLNEDYYVTVSDSIRGTQRTRTFDGAGRLSRCDDAGGSVAYGYGYVTRDGRILDSVSFACGSAVTVALSDIRGNRVELRDPDAGTVSSVHDALGRLVSSTDANGVVTSRAYDLLGRVTRVVRSDGVSRDTVSFVYDSATGKGRGKIHRVRHNGADERVYSYDNLGRLSEEETVDGVASYLQRYAYDALGRLDLLTYPDGYCLSHSYNSYGELAAVTDAATDSLVVSIDTRDQWRHPLKCRFGNGTGAQYTYDGLGRLTAVRNGDVTDAANINGFGTGPGPDVTYTVGTEYRQLAYAYDARGFIATRTEANASQSEAYAYDVLDRLASYTVNGLNTASFTYDGTGNIATNSKVGAYSYGDAGPHAVTGLAGGFACPVPNAQCDVTYGLWNRPTRITESGYDITLDYGADGVRRHTRFLYNGILRKTATRVSGYHEVEATASATRRLDYVYAEGRVVAVHVQNGSSDSLYYVLTDHLGSWEIVMDQSKNTVQRTHFDPWGNRMSYTAWNTPQTQVAFPFSRGFTGHEHYDRFKIINANARLYDPVIGRFFSPDPYVQMPDFTQNYNRYSYCMNNPVMNCDPDGEWVHIVVGAVIGGVSNLIGNWRNCDGFWQYAAAFGAGAASGAVSAALPGWGSLIGGVITGATNSTIAQTGNNFSSNGSFSWSQFGTSCFAGAAAGIAGYGGGILGAKATNVAVGSLNIVSPVTKGFVGGVLGGSIGGFTGGFAGGLVMTKGNIDAALSAGLSGAFQGASLGGATGVAGGFYYAHKHGLNPWTGVKNGSVTIGEGMSRVAMIQKQLKNETIERIWPNGLDAYIDKNARIINSEAMDFNAQWIEFLKEQNAYIYDIGTPNGSPVSSPFYNMEQARTMDYLNLIKVNGIDGRIIWYRNGN